VTPEQLIAVVGAFTALFIAIAGVLVQVASLKRSVNGRLTQLLELTATSSRAEGTLAENQRMVDTPIGTKVPE